MLVTASVSLASLPFLFKSDLNVVWSKYGQAFMIYELRIEGVSMDCRKQVSRHSDENRSRKGNKSNYLH